MKKILASLTILATVLAFIPTPAFAAFSGTHHYTCSDWNLYAVSPAGKVTCTGSTITFVSGISQGGVISNLGTDNLGNHQTVYITWTYSGSGTTCILSGNCPDVHASGNLTNFSYTDNGSQNPPIIFDYNTDNFVGTIANVCISDSSTGCNAASAPSNFGILTWFGWF